MRGRLAISVAVSVLLLSACGGAGGDDEGGATAVVDATVDQSGADAGPLDTLEARIIDLVNDVDAHARPDEDWVDAVVDMLIHNGGEVWAQEASTARVETEDVLVRVAPNTIFTLGQPEPDVLELNLEEGQIWINVEGLAPGESLEVETPSATALVLGTRFSVRIDTGLETVVSSQEGDVVVSAAGSVVTVTAGHETRVPLGDPPSVPQSMTGKESILWGVAMGAGLDVVLPVVGEAQIVRYPYSYAGKPQCAYQGTHLAVYHTDIESYTTTYSMFDIVTGDEYTMSLPYIREGVALNPVDSSLAYPGYQEICVSNLEFGQTSCFPAGPTLLDLEWSPDGEWLAYSGLDLSTTTIELFRARPDGSDLEQLTFGSESNLRFPHWSPDGSLIAYQVIPDGRSAAADLVVMSADGAISETIAAGQADPYMDFTWSSDGSTLAYAGYVGEAEDGPGGMWTVTYDGSDGAPIPGTEGWTCYNAHWSPTAAGWPLFFKCQSGDEGAYYTWYVTGPGEEPEKLVYARSGPIWCPEGNQVIFEFSSQVEGEQVIDAYIFDIEPTLFSE